MHFLNCVFCIFAVFAKLSLLLTAINVVFLSRTVDCVRIHFDTAYIVSGTGSVKGRASICLSISPVIRPLHTTVVGLLLSDRQTRDIH